MPTSAPRVQTSSGPRPVGPTHVYPAGSQMMMIPQQQISFPGSPQGYFIPPGQVGSHVESPHPVTDIGIVRLFKYYRDFDFFSVK